MCIRDSNITVKAKEYCFAFDGMIVDFEKLGEQQNVFPLLNQAFAEEKEEEKKNTDEETSI